MATLVDDSTDKRQFAGSSPAEIRAAIRSGGYVGDSWELAPGYAQAAFVAVPRALALDFATFAQRNPRPCPLLEITDPGDPILRAMGDGIDVRTDLSGYRVFEDGAVVDRPIDITDRWTDDLVGFVIGCTGSFESHIQRAGIRLRYLDEGLGVSVFRTNIECAPAGMFRGPMVVSMRPIKSNQIPKLTQLTSRFPAFHGAPIHVGSPGAIGIASLADPLDGDYLPLLDDEEPVFWACSVTPQLIAREARIPQMITNAPGYMLITDVRSDDLAISA
jgi:uncharacterized protein YcsI (UPF0317 family)